MRIMVRMGEPLWRSVGSLRLALVTDRPTVTVADVLATLAAEYPDFEAAFRGEDLGHPMPYQVFVNAILVAPGSESQRVLADGDRVYIFLPAAGGSHGSPLDRVFYLRPTLEVARSLLGMRLVRIVDGQRISGRIVEAEAYVGEDDKASHASRGMTSRNRSMYGPGGSAYVYLIYGLHYCLNVVTEREGFPAAVLIRALTPLEGTEFMVKQRPGHPLNRLADGPGKLCQALAIDRTLDGHDLTAGITLWIEPGPPVSDSLVVATPRINVRGDARAQTAPWRFRIEETAEHSPERRDDPFVVAPTGQPVSDTP